MAPVLSVVVTGTGVVPLEVPFPPAVPFIPPAPPATVELLPPAPVVELLAPVWRAPAAPASVTVEVELALDAPAPPVATITVAVPADEVAVTVVAEVELDDSASRKRCQQFQNSCGDFHGPTLAVVGAVGKDGVGVGARRARLDCAVVNTAHKGRLGAEANDISRAIWAAKAGGQGQHVFDACLLHGRQQIVRSIEVVSKGILTPQGGRLLRSDAVCATVTPAKSAAPITKDFMLARL